MSTGKHSLTHFPLLYNPLLNSIFNNPNYTKSPFKGIFDELSANHTDFTILVPSSSILHKWGCEISANSTVPLKELCYTEDFIRSHIIKSKTSYSTSITPINKVQSVIYGTSNGRQILIKNGQIFTGKGFKKSIRTRILSINYFKPFSEYFPKGAKFMVVFIDDTLFGSVSQSHSLNAQIRSDATESVTDDVPKREGSTKTVTFEQLLRSLPVLSQTVSDDFYSLFHQNNKHFQIFSMKGPKKLTEIDTEFQRILSEAYGIIQHSVSSENSNGEEVYKIINQLIHRYPDMDLNNLVHEYVQLNLYDKIWAQLIFQFNHDSSSPNYDPEAKKVLTTETYQKLSYVSLNQLDIPVEQPWYLNVLYRRVSNAIEEFSTLQDPSITSSEGKTDILIRAVNILTDHSNPTNSKIEVKQLHSELIIDADTLLGLLIMVLIHSKLENIEAHIYYIRHFNSRDVSSSGYLNYILSNIDAVLFHLSTTGSEGQIESLFKSSQSNFEFWSCIQSENHLKFEQIISQIQETYGNDVPNSHHLYSKNINGESCLMMALKSKNYRIFEMLLEYNPNWFSIDDILFDKNTTTNQSLLIAALVEGQTDFADKIIEVIIQSASLEEQRAYLNSTDVLGRSVGHYFFHHYTLIDKIGHLIDWELKDTNSHTPLFSLCRCYDHANYADLIKKGFSCVYKKYGRGRVDMDKHKDKSDNSLLHVILKNLEDSELLSETSNLVNINASNNKGLPPLFHYVKYSRLDNLEKILQDSRLLFFFESSNLFYNVFDYLGFSSTRSLTPNPTHQSVEKLIYEFAFDKYTSKTADTRLLATHAKFELNSNDWFVFFRDSNGSTGLKSINELKQILYISKVDNLMTIFPEEDTFWLNYSIESNPTPLFHKYRVNRLINNLNILLESLRFQANIDRHVIFTRILEKSKSDQKQESTLDAIKQINNKHMQKRTSLGNPDMIANNFKEMQFFLQFSVADLKKYEAILSRFNKLLVAQEIKESDYRVVFDESIQSLTTNKFILPSKIRSNLAFEFHPHLRSEDSSVSQLHGYTSWIESSLLELMRNISKVQDKISYWKELNREMSNLSAELAIMRNLQLNESADEDVKSQKDDSTFMGLGNLFTNKKFKYKRYTNALSECETKISKLGQELRYEYEIIAAEISNFLRFRSDFLALGMRIFVHESIALSKFRHDELRSHLFHLRKIK